MRLYIALGIVLMVFGLFGCRGKNKSPEASLRFEVEHVFYINLHYSRYSANLRPPLCVKPYKNRGLCGNKEGGRGTPHG
jgi:hypothetical protein